MCYLYLYYFTQQFPKFILVVRDSLNSFCCLDISAIFIFICLTIAWRWLVYRLSRSCSVTYWGISVDVKICGKPFREIVFFAFHQYLTTNFHLNIFLLGIIFLSSYLLLEMMCRYILFQIFNKLYLFLFFADVYAMQERSHNISHLQ